MKFNDTSQAIVCVYAEHCSNAVAGKKLAVVVGTAKKGFLQWVNPIKLLKSFIHWQCMPSNDSTG